MAEKFDLIGIGAANVDLLLKVERFPLPDEEVSVKDFYIESGGSAANVVVGVARLGFKTGFIGSIGKDYFGECLHEGFQKEIVDTSHMRAVDKKTGVAVSIVDGEGERMICVYGEANMELSPDDIREEYIGKSRSILITSIQGDKALEALKLASDYAYRQGVMIVFDPGCILVERGLNAIRGVLERSTVAKFNEREISMLTGSEKMEDAFKRLERVGLKNIIVTLGRRGCLIKSEANVKSIPSYSGFEVLDRTGAGDAFNIGLLAGMLKDWGLEDSARFGNLIAGISVTRMGARASPSLSELKGYPEFDEFKGRI